MKLGELKSKILTILSESYISNDKKEIKKILNLLENDEDIKNLYIFYEEFENNEISTDNEEKYINSIEELLIKENKRIKNNISNINKNLKKVNFEKNDIYECLDILSEETTVFNLSKKLDSKNKLINHLKTKKEKVNESVIYNKNQKLFETMLVNTFNYNFKDQLNDKEIKYLNKITSFTENDFIELKESLNKNIDNLLNESNESSIVDKLQKVKSDVNLMKINKLNYYKLLELKNDLD